MSPTEMSITYEPGTYTKQILKLKSHINVI